MARRVAGARPAWWVVLAISAMAQVSIEAAKLYTRVAVLERSVEKHQTVSELDIDKLQEKIIHCECAR